MNDATFPTIEQIIRKGDSLAGVPMDGEEAREWFEQTCVENAAKGVTDDERERRDQAQF